MVETSRTERSSYHHGDLRNASIEAGLDLLAQEGFDTLSLRAVARRLGVTHAALYRHFADKTALLAAIAERGFDLLVAETSAATNAASDCESRFVACGVAYVRFALRHPDYFRVMFSGWTGDRSQHPDLSAAVDRSFAVLVAIIRDGQAAQVIQTGDPTVIALAAWSGVHGLSMLLLEQQISPPEHITIDPERLARRCILISFYGVAARNG